MPTIIGITCKKREEITNYIRAIEQYGGESRPFVSLRDTVPDDIREIDELLLPGGGAIGPCRYNELRYHVKREFDKRFAFVVQTFSLRRI